MQKYCLLLMACLAICVSAVAQTTSVSFKKERDTLRRGSAEVIGAISLVVTDDKIDPADKSKYTLTVKADNATSTLPQSAYTLDFSSTAYDKISSEYTLYIRLKKDDELDRDREIHLSIEVKKEGETKSVNTSGKATMVLVVEASRTLNSYNYLAYVGTNFDLVDGVQAKNLFFATNILTTPTKKKTFGFSITLYGNRTTTTTDTSGRLSYTSKAVPIGGDTARFYTENALKTTSRVSDNLGASFSPLFRLWKWSDVNRPVQVFYAPQWEIIWRRTTIATKYTDVQLVDSVDRPNRPFSGTVILTEPASKTNLNVYDIYLGLLGVMVNHENKFISVRVNAAVGLNVSYVAGRGGGATRANEIKTSYTRISQMFFFTRTWITEPVSGVTIGAEVSNTLFRRANAQPYFNVTLSKAINLSSLAGIFQPVTSR